MPQPSIAPIPPTQGKSHPLAGLTAAWLGSSPDCLVRSEETGVLDHHAALEAHADGWYLSGGRGRTLINGVPLRGLHRLCDRDVIELASHSRFEFVSGEKRTRRMESAADMIAPPRPQTGTMPKSPRQRPVVAIAVVAVSVLLFAMGIGVIWFGLFQAGRSPDVLTDQEAGRFDSLLVVAYDHIERGGTLLELGLGDAAIAEFVTGVNTLALSDLRDHPQVKPRIEALEATVAAIYRERKLQVPEAYASAKAAAPEEGFREASLSRANFAEAFTRLSAAFQRTFEDTIVVVGRDHAEHVALYGKGGALDLRTKTMSRREVDFVINQCRVFGIRVKDFSQDSILRRQIQAAMQAGLLDRAGTGLHLHIDRFANRRDRWTVSLLLPLIGRSAKPARPRTAGSHQQELEPRHSRDGEFGAVMEGTVLAPLEQFIAEVSAVQG